MAWAQIPPCGAMHRAEVNRQKRILEQTTVDPVLRYKLREERLSAGFTEFGNALVSKAKANARALEEREREAQRIEQEYYKNKYKEI